MENPRNIRIDGVELHWPKLATPVENVFNKAERQYELLIQTKDAEKAKEMKANGLNVKEKDGVFSVNLKRKEKKANGEDNGPVRVVNGDLTPFGDPTSIGNGSIGNVIIFQYPWSNMGRSGIGSSLTAVQVTTLVPFTPKAGGVDFDVVGGAASPQTAEQVEAAGADLF